MPLRHPHEELKALKISTKKFFTRVEELEK